MHIQYIYIYIPVCLCVRAYFSVYVCVYVYVYVFDCICTWIWICWIWTCLGQCINIDYILQMLFYSYSIYWVWSSYNEIWWRDPKSLFFEAPFLASRLVKLSLCLTIFTSCVYMYVHIWCISVSIPIYLKTYGILRIWMTSLRKHLFVTGHLKDNHQF